MKALRGGDGMMKGASGQIWPDRVDNGSQRSYDKRALWGRICGIWRITFGRL